MIYTSNIIYHKVSFLVNHEDQANDILILTHTVCVGFGGAEIENDELSGIFLKVTHYPCFLFLWVLLSLSLLLLHFLYCCCCCCTMNVVVVFVVKTLEFCQNLSRIVPRICWLQPTMQWPLLTLQLHSYYHLCSIRILIRLHAARMLARYFIWGLCTQNLSLPLTQP